MFSFYIAKRYLITKKSHHVINVISGISVCGIAIATAALVCILSVFNGFQDMVANLFTAFDPELKIVAAEGKFMDADSKELTSLKTNRHIAVCSEVLQDNALIMKDNRQMMVTVKGVDDNFQHLIDFDRIKFGDGNYELHADVIEYGIFGINILSGLGADVAFTTPIQVYAPRGGERIDMNDPSESFNNDELYSPGVAFCVKQQKYDSNYVLTSLRFARNLFERKGKVSSVELKLTKGSDADKVKKELESQLGDRYVVMDRYEQQEDTFKIMKIEKLISYIFLTFILLIACFNIIGSISMLIIDKKNDIAVLRNLGATERQITDIFMMEGRIISFIGAVAGVVLGLALCLLQQHYGLIKFGQSAGSYIIDAYPVSVHASDIILILVTVIIVGFLSVWYPVRQLSRKYASVATVLLAFACLTSCSSDDHRFRIKGQFDGMPSGQLLIYNLSDETAGLDTIYIENGGFAYGGTVKDLTPYILVFPNALEQVIFVGGGDDIRYTASANDLKNYRVDGNESNELMNKFRKETEKMSGTEVRDKAHQYITDNAESPVAIYLFERYFVQDDTTPLSTLKKIIKQLKKVNPDKGYLMSVNNKIKQMEAGQVGKTVPDLQLKSKSKRDVHLRDDKCKYTTVIYWASWMPDQYGYLSALSSISRQFSSKGVRFISVSLDTEIYKWKDFIREDSVACEHCCDGYAWDSPAVARLGVTSVPTYLLVDNKHKIVARGEELAELRKKLNGLIKE